MNAFVGFSRPMVQELKSSRQNLCLEPSSALSTLEQRSCGDSQSPAEKAPLHPESIGIFFCDLRVGRNARMETLGFRCRCRNMPSYHQNPSRFRAPDFHCPWLIGGFERYVRTRRPPDTPREVACMPNGPSGMVPGDYRHHGTRTGPHDSHVTKSASVNFDLVC